MYHRTELPRRRRLPLLMIQNAPPLNKQHDQAKQRRQLAQTQTGQATQAALLLHGLGTFSFLWRSLRKFEMHEQLVFLGAFSLGNLVSPPHPRWGGVCVAPAQALAPGSPKLAGTHHDQRGIPNSQSAAEELMFRLSGLFLGRRVPGAEPPHQRSAVAALVHGLV